MTVPTIPAAVVRDAVPADADSIARIYNHYVLNTIVTFEEDAISAQTIDGRLADTRAANLPFVVAERGRQVCGYAYASKWKGRCAYRFSAEVTVYVDCEHGAQGIGSTLYAHLLPVLRQQGIHAAIGGIALPNDASVALHEKFGFVQVAQFREVGRKFERWIDVGYWQRVFES